MRDGSLGGAATPGTGGVQTAPDAVRLEVATTGQRLLWALDRVRGESGALNCPAVCRLDGPLEVARLHAAIQRLAARHVALRTVILPGRPLRQAFHASRDIPLGVHDAAPDDADGAGWLRRDLARRIEATVSPTRASLLRLGRDRHLLVLNVHHVVTDMWSTNVLFDDLANELRDPYASTEPSFPQHARGWDLADYAEWERLQLTKGAFARQQRYWFDRLAGMAPLRTPMDSARADRVGSTGLLEATIESATRRRLEAVGSRLGASTFATLIAVLFSQSHRETGDRDLTVGSLVAARARAELQRTVAFLVNMLMLRVRLRPESSFRDVVEESQRAIGGALAHADLPFHALSPVPPRVVSRDNARADDMVFHVSAERLERQYDVGSLRVTSVVPEVVGRFDLELAVRPTVDTLVARLTYNDRRITPENARRILDGYVQTARDVVVAPESPLRAQGG